MKPLSKVLSTLLGLTFLGALAASAYFCLKYIAGLFSPLDQQVALVTAIAAAVMLLSAMIISSGMRWAKERENEHRQRAERAALYDSFLSAWTATLRPETGNNHVDSGHTRPARTDADKYGLQLLLRGHVNVIKAYKAFRQLEKEGGRQSTEAKSAAVNVLLEMRQDLKLSVEGLQANDWIDLLFGADDGPRRRLETAFNAERKIRFPAT
jgi:hypothetical protein